jgi:hypothetical protein
MRYLEKEIGDRRMKFEVVPFLFQKFTYPL